LQQPLTTDLPDNAGDPHEEQKQPPAGGLFSAHRFKRWISDWGVVSFVPSFYEKGGMKFPRQSHK
jgi:hypothetical protein